MRKFLLGAVLLLVVVGCKEVKEGKQLNLETEGKTTIGWYYYYLAEGDFDKVYEYVDDTFKEGNPKDAFAAATKERQAVLGDVVETTLIDWRDTEKGDKKAKTKEFEFKYEVKYSNGETKQEDFILIRKDYGMLINSISNK